MGNFKISLEGVKTYFTVMRLRQAAYQSRGLWEHGEGIEDALTQLKFALKLPDDFGSGN